MEMTIEKILKVLDELGLDVYSSESKDGLCTDIKIFKEKHDDEFYRGYFGL